jgi:hypothetical protein
MVKASQTRIGIQKNGHYRVRLENNWIDVPDDAIITEPNRAGRTMVWSMRKRPRRGAEGVIDGREHGASQDWPS